jgi:hypothetical protein
MPDIDPHIPSRAPAATSEDDTILPFQVEALDLRVVRFGRPSTPSCRVIAIRFRSPSFGEAIVLRCCSARP